MFFYIALTPISTTSGLRSTGNTRKYMYHQIDVGFPNCGGKIDSRHISIIALSEHHVDYMNRKGWYSVIMQGEPFCVHRMAWIRARRQGSGKL